MNIHTYTSSEPMMKVNAFIVESSKELAIVDTTLTMSDSLALRQKADRLGKPVAGIIITHGHPDHVAGIGNVSPSGDVPIYSLASVRDLMTATEELKHRQWSSVFGSEWIPKWVYPNTVVNDGETVEIGEMRFTVMDLGAGGDCDANSIWMLQDEEPVAFVGDFLYSKNHTYMADGGILRWLANLETHGPLLEKYKTYFVGHGPSCDFSAIAEQKKYFLTYCSNVLAVTGGTGIFTEEAKKNLEKTMLSLHPDYGCQFMVGLSAERVGKELMSVRK